MNAAAFRVSRRVSSRAGFNRKYFFFFVLGISVGFVLTALFFDPKVPTRTFEVIRRKMQEASRQSKYNENKPISVLHHNMALNSTFAEEMLMGVEEVSALKLSQEVRVLCWVMTNPQNHYDKAIHVKATWGRHCNMLLFMSETEDLNLPTIKLDVLTGRPGLWSKTVEAFKYVHRVHRGDYDWVLKADDDTFVVVENLRHMLLPHLSSDPHYFGFHFKPYAPKGYMSGGAGYVLSKESVDRLVNRALDGRDKNCPLSSSNGAEDINLAKCLSAVGVKPEDTRDSQGKSRFHPFVPEFHLKPTDPNEQGWWYTEYRYWPVTGGLACCSNKPISFHYVKPEIMYVLEYLIYQVRVFPVTHLVTAKPKPMLKTTTASPTPPANWQDPGQYWNRLSDNNKAAAYNIKYNWRRKSTTENPVERERILKMLRMLYRSSSTTAPNNYNNDFNKI